MKAIQVSKPGGPLELVEREIPVPPPNWVRIKVQACGVCHSDMMMKEGQWPGLQYPRVPGHEAAGVIDALGANVTTWAKGQRVGVGWYGGHCGVCNPCRRGDLINCANGSITGFTYDGGYAEYMIAPAQSLAAIPDDVSPEDAGPLMCAGVTTFNALRHAGALPGDLVAVSRGTGAKELALKLGAHSYIDSEAAKPAEELQKMGGAKAILSTAPSGKAMSGLIDGLGVNGTLMVIGASADNIEVSSFQLIPGTRSIRGWSSGVAADSEDTLRFSSMTAVRAMIVKFPIERASEAYDRMMSGKAQFRVVLTM
jgi:D-arabinose 1-dehydrogenase-like Zn-dependent alcohol dehydrogenase